MSDLAIFPTIALLTGATQKRMQSKRTMPPNTQITDVAKFFSTITEEYEYFERNVLQIIDQIPTCSPQQIQAQCSKISQQRDKLAIMDEQMFAIIDLAGSEIAHTSMIHTYRVAFTRATMACNNLYQSLQALRATL